MKLSNRYQYMILCEDAQMNGFIRAFLKCSDINAHKRRTIAIPAGDGCGEQHVRKRLPQEIKILHSNNFLKLALIVCIDADKYSYEERKRVLIESAKKSGCMSELEEEMVLIWIPKREIETWVAYFNGENPDEETSFKHGGSPVSCKLVARAMYLYLQDLSNIKDPVLPSLIKAKEEYDRMCTWQQKM